MEFKLTRLNDRPVLIGENQPETVPTVKQVIAKALNRAACETVEDAEIAISIVERMFEGNTTEITLSEKEANMLRQLLEMLPLIAVQKVLVNSKLIIEIAEVEE